MPVKNSEAYSQTLQELESDIVKQEQEQQLSAAEILKRKRAREAKRLEEIRAAAAAAFELEEAKRKQEEEAAEERRRKKREHEARKAREAAEFEERELERKTKPFFKLGRFNKHVPTGVVYFGDHIMEGGAWVPHGYLSFAAPASPDLTTSQPSVVASQVWRVPIFREHHFRGGFLPG